MIWGCCGFSVFEIRSFTTPVIVFRDSAEDIRSKGMDGLDGTELIAWLFVTLAPMLPQECGGREHVESRATKKVFGIPSDDCLDLVAFGLTHD